MPFVPRSLRTVAGTRFGRAKRALVALAALSPATWIVGCGGSGEGSIITPQEVGSITINSPSFLIERGTSVTLTATVVDIHGQPLNVPVVWSSSNEKAASF